MTENAHGLKAMLRHVQSTNARVRTWSGSGGICVLEQPEPARLVLLSADLFAELEPLPGGYRVLWASDRRLLACDVLDERALDAAGRALVR